MWIMSRDGMLSAVQDRESPYHLLVRGRRKKDLKKLAQFAYVHIRRMDDADYPYRVRVTKPVFAKFMADNIADIQYDNFKDSIKKRDKQYRDFLGYVWLRGIDLEKQGERIHPYLRFT